MATIPMSAVSMIPTEFPTPIVTSVMQNPKHTFTARTRVNTSHFGSGDSEFSRHTFGIALSPRKAVATLRHDGVEVLDVISDRVQSILGDRGVFAADTMAGTSKKLKFFVVSGLFQRQPPQIYRGCNTLPMQTFYVVPCALVWIGNCVEYT
jgi:hypothetical protein